MDGNRRWAKKRMMQPWLGHKEGAKSVKLVSEFCLKNKIPFLSLYLFSLENFNRSEQEKTYFFEKINEEINNNAEELFKQGIKVKFVGDRNFFPKNVIGSCEKIEKLTKDCKNLNLNFLFCYGGRQEIINCVKNISNQVKNGLIKEEDISEELFDKYLWLGQVPAPEIIIRTGGQQRLSNFLSFQAAYSELFFLDSLWPDLKETDIESVLQDFEKRKRNFGA